MNVFRRLPVNIDYILGVLMLLTSVYQLYQYGLHLDGHTFVKDLAYYTFLPYFEIFVGGLVMIAFPRKNLRRTIWLVSIIIGVNLVLLGQSEYMTYDAVRYTSMTSVDLYAYSIQVLTFAVVHIGCGLAMFINGALFAAKRVRSLYTLIIALQVSLVTDIFAMDVSYHLDGMSLRALEMILVTYAPHFILQGVFEIVFTSREVSWYTAKGDILRAFNRLLTVSSTFGITNIERNQLIMLMQCEGEYTLRLRMRRMVCNLEVRPGPEGRTLVFCRNGVDSMASAVYVKLISICLPDTLSKSQYVDIYGEGGVHIRLSVSEPRKRFVSRETVRYQYENGVLPKFRHKVSNASLYHIVDGAGGCDIMRKKDPEYPGRLEVTETEDGRVVTVYRNDGDVFCTMPVRAMVPVNEFGAFTKLYVYGDMG